MYVLRAAQGVVGDPGSLGIVIGGSGNGEQIAANKVPGVRAALAWTTETAQLARQHNDANVLSLGARMYTDRGRGRLREGLRRRPRSPATPGTPGGWPRSPTTRRPANSRPCRTPSLSSSTAPHAAAAAASASARQRPAPRPSAAGRRPWPGRRPGRPGRPGYRDRRGGPARSGVSGPAGRARDGRLLLRAWPPPPAARRSGRDTSRARIAPDSVILICLVLCRTPRSCQSGEPEGLLTIVTRRSSGTRGPGPRSWRPTGRPACPAAAR